MQIKQTILALSMLASCAISVAMDNDNDVPSIQEIDDVTSSIRAVCAQECNFLKDVTDGCTSKCWLDNHKRLATFLVRKFTDNCLGNPSTDVFNLNPTSEELLAESNKTLRAYDFLAEATINECNKRKMDIFSSRLSFLQSKNDRAVTQFEQEHPIRAKVADIKSKVRGLGRKQADN